MACIVSRFRFRLESWPANFGPGLVVHPVHIPFLKLAPMSGSRLRVATRTTPFGSAFPTIRYIDNGKDKKGSVHRGEFVFANLRISAPKKVRIKKEE